MRVLNRAQFGIRGTAHEAWEGWLPAAAARCRLSGENANETMIVKVTSPSVSAGAGLDCQKLPNIDSRAEGFSTFSIPGAGGAVVGHWRFESVAGCITVIVSGW